MSSRPHKQVEHRASTGAGFRPVTHQREPPPPRRAEDVGDGGYGGSRSVEVYDPSADTWTRAPDMLAEHGYHRGVVLADGRFLVVGGYGTGDLRLAEIFSPR